jgi:hypothetical protein
VHWFLAILAVLLGLLLLLCLLRVGVLVTFGQPATAHLLIGPVRVQVAPADPNRKKPKKEKKKPEKPKKEAGRGKEFPKPTLEDIRSAYETLWPPMKKALRRTRRDIRIAPLQLSLVIGGREDPAGAAELYGYLSAGVWTVMPALEELLVIPAPSIHLEPDFDRADNLLEGRVGLSVRIGTLLAVGLQVGFPALKWVLRYLKKHRKNTERKGTPECAPTESAAA